MLTLIGEAVLGLDSEEFHDLADPPRPCAESKLGDCGEPPTPATGRMGWKS